MRVDCVFQRVNNEYTEINYCTGYVIRKLRRRKKMSGKQLGCATGYSQQQISRYERGLCMFTLPVLECFAEAFCMTIWNLLDEIKICYFTHSNSVISHEKCAGWIY